MTQAPFNKIDLPTRRRLLKIGLGGLVMSGVAGFSWATESSDSAAYPGDVRALVFDVFGTVADWHGSIVREGQLLSRSKGYDVDWVEFATRWRSGYGPAMNKVRSGELPWTKLDDLHRLVLDELAVEFGLTGMSEAELEDFNRAWHRLSPWPDSVAGLTRLRRGYVISTLSNGNVSLLVDMAKNAGLPWDAVLSAELARHYKPDARAYIKAAELLSLRPEQVMLVAAHPSDLRGAAAAGLRTAYVHRPSERGPRSTITPPAKDEFDMFSTGLLDLAEQFGL
jgi:2-haloacid dehalogenase